MFLSIIDRHQDEVVLVAYAAGPYGKSAKNRFGNTR